MNYAHATSPKVQFKTVANIFLAANETKRFPDIGEIQSFWIASNIFLALTSDAASVCPVSDDHIWKLFYCLFNFVTIP